MEKKTKRKEPDKQENKQENKETEKLSHDSHEKSYYYDDAHGYETYDPSEDEERDEN